MAKTSTTKLTHTHVVLRPFDGHGRRFERDERVDASDWRTVAALERQRYIRPLAVSDVPELAGARKEA